MKKIKYLHGFLILLLILNTLFFIAEFYNFFTFYKLPIFEEEYKYSDFVLGQVVSLIGILGLFFLKRALYSIIKEGFFNNIAFSNLNKSGLFFILSGLGSIVTNVVVFIRHSYSSMTIIDNNLGEDLLLITVGFSLYIIADLVKNGNVLKSENDLTI